MLRNGSIQADYELSRIINIRDFVQKEQVYERTKGEISRYIDSGDIRAAADAIHKAECEPDMLDKLLRRDWMEMRDQVARKCFQLDQEKSWTEFILSEIDRQDPLSFSADSQLLLCGEKLYRVADGTLLADHGKAGHRCVCSGISPDGSFYLRANAKGFEQVDAKSGTIRQEFKVFGTVTVLVISPDGQYALAGGESSFYFFCHLPSGRIRTCMSPGGNVKHAVITYDNREVILQTTGNILRIVIDTQEVVPLFKIDDKKCPFIAVDTQFRTLLITQTREWLSEPTGVIWIDMQNGMGRKLDAKDARGLSLTITNSPHKADFCRNDMDVLYIIEQSNWIINPENDQFLDRVVVPDAIDDCVVSRDGKHAAISAGGSLYLQRWVTRFTYADEENGLNQEDFESLIDLRANFFAKRRGYEQNLPSIREQVAEELGRAVTPRKMEMLAPYRLRPYARITVASDLRKKEKDQVDALMKELEDRGMGYIRRENVEKYMKEARREAGMR